MAKVRGPLMSLTASGLVGSRLVFSQRKTGQQVRFQRSNIDANTFDQKTNRAVYQDSVAEWNLLSVAEKNVWKNLAKGRSLTGFNLFIKDYYMNTIRKLATVENIDFKVLGKTQLYTVPTGAKAIIFGIVIRTTAFEDIGGDGIARLIRRSDEDQYLNFSSSVLGEVDYFTNVFPLLDPGGGGFIVSAADGFDFEVTTADTGTALVVDVDLIGYLIEA